MTRRDRVPRLRSTAGTFALGAFALLSVACESVPDLTFDPGDASHASDARADAGDASDGSAIEASAQSDACAFPCEGTACAERCTECAANCQSQSGTRCCAKVSGPVLCRLTSKPCPAP